MNFPTIPGVCDVKLHKPSGQERGWLVIEIPHGATRKSDYDAVATKLKSSLPKDLIHFFFVNTDIGAPESAEYLGRTLSKNGIGVLIARCLMPRTFIDTNRVIAQTTQGVVKDGLTPALPGYIESAEDSDLLHGVHAKYHEAVAPIYDWVCRTRNGLALQLHSYAPRSVQVEKTDAGIIDALHAAYEPETFRKWPERPAVDIICATADGSFQCAPHLVSMLKANYAEAGMAAQENATYHLHPATMGLVYAKKYPEKVLCVELNRGLLADPFVPFGESPISAEKVERMTKPIAQVLRAAFS